MGRDLAGDGAPGPQGKVIYVGSSNFAGWHIAGANEAAARGTPRSGVRAEPVQPDARTIELEVVPACQDYGIGILPWSPLAGGMLAGALAGPNRGADEPPRAAAGERVGCAPPPRLGEGLRRARRTSRPTLPWPGCWQSGGDRADLWPRTLEQFDGSSPCDRHPPRCRGARQTGQDLPRSRRLRPPRPTPGRS